MNTKLATLAVALTFACGDDAQDPPATISTPNALSVDGVFEPGTRVRDAYSGQTYEVNSNGIVVVDAGDAPAVLLERDQAPGDEAAFSWNNATVYFAMTDRFENGDPSNDNSYGRTLSADSADFGAFHGGDFAGLTSRLDYLADLGVNALWISPPVEQIHGYVGGGNGAWQHFAYAGYWALDFTRLDANFGTEDELRTLVEEAHARGIRIVFDVVLNHPGYATIADLEAYTPDVLFDGYERWLTDVTLDPMDDAADDFNDMNRAINFDSNMWGRWWGSDWIRAGFPFHDLAPVSDVLLGQLAFLPDFKTERAEPPAALPLFFENKPDTRVVEIPGATVRDYLVAWHTDWVRRFGIDGFRVDTAKHVELGTWTALREAADAALAEWRSNNPDDPLVAEDQPFWMVGEAFPPVTNRDGYFPAGFDAMINFDLQSASGSIIGDPDATELFYADLAQTVAPDGRSELTFASNHDTELFFDRAGEDFEAQTDLGSTLLMTPGAVQLFYGDESARPAGPPAGDAENPTRSDMNWDQHDEPERAALIEHFQRLGKFRQSHRAVGEGAHQQLEFNGEGYAFARTLDDPDDAVVVVMLP
jgi:alpha-amylase